MVTQSNSPVTTTWVGTVIIVNKFNCWEYGERGKELKVPHYANAAAVYDSNLLYIKATCLILRQLASNNSHLPLFLIIPLFNYIAIYKVYRDKKVLINII